MESRFLPAQAGPGAPHEVRRRGATGGGIALIDVGRGVVPGKLAQFAAVACLALGTAAPHPPARAAPARAPAPLTLPAPGSYTLQRILKAPDGIVLDSDGSVHRLSEFTTGKITLFSFIYTYCTDAKGCPLAYETLHGLKKTLAADKALAGKVRFVSMSFDPRYDTPVAMRSYGGDDARDRGPLRWHFLTTRTGAELAPMLDGFGQDVSVVREQPPGARVPTLSHLLKVYLLDRLGQVREIYSTSFLNQAVLLNDITTLLMEAERQPPRSAGAFVHTGIHSAATGENPATTHCQLLANPGDTEAGGRPSAQ